jgi:hypothetical protein
MLFDLSSDQPGTAPGAAQDPTGGGRAPGDPSLSNRFLVFGGPLWFDRDSICANAAYVFVIRAATSDEATDLARETIEAPVGSPISPRIRVESLFQSFEERGAATVVALAKSPYSTFEMDVNGEGNYATLGDGATQTALPGGLWRIDAPVSYLDIHGYNLWNWVTLRTRHGGNASLQTTEFAMMHED